MTEQTTTSTVLIHLTIDGKEIAVPKGTTVYTATQKLGINIPIFCYQDRMPPFGACRVCLVEVEKSPKLQTSCTLEATEGMIVHTQSHMAVEGRKGILEFLLINHPLDCPICDRGGECPLQEQTLKFGPGESRFFEEKRHFKKPLPLGPVLMLDRERCIVCARCTRFGDEIAGDHALEFIERGYRTEVGTPHGGPAESKFIGNTIMICPVGALTSQVYRFRARPWDNDPTQSTCTLCPVGCSMILDARDGEIMRTRSQEKSAVNDIWMCDKGWFGYEFTSNPERLQYPLIRRGGKLEKATWDEALTLVASKIREAKPKGKLAGFGGNPLTVEENFLFQKLLREVAGVNHVDHRIGMPLLDLAEEGIMPGMEISIGDCEQLDYVFLLGIDLTEEFPVIWLRLKQAINRGAKVIFIGHFAPEIKHHMAETIVHRPGLELQMIKAHLTDLQAYQGKGALFVGRQYLANTQRKTILAQLLQISKAQPNLSLNILEGRNNSIGATVAGMRPDLGPLGKKITNPGLNALQVLTESAKNGWDVLYVAGADPARRFPSKLWSEARAKLNFLVVQDLFLTKTALQADVVLPTLSYVEKGGSFINIEGRVQTLMPGKEIPEIIYSDAGIFRKLAENLQAKLEMDPFFSTVLKTEKLSLTRPEKIDAVNIPQGEIPEGSLLATYAYMLFDQGVRMKHNPHVALLVKETGVRLHPEEGKKRSLQDGESARLNALGNSITVTVKLDDSVSKGTVVLPLWFEQVPVRELGTNLMNGFVVEIASL